ncbi:MAG: pyridoxal phosphate-dependent aminotransferase [bacterium]
MPSAKSYLKNIYRIPILKDSRKGFLRLDMNENPGGLPEKFIRRMLCHIDRQLLASYPEYASLIQKIAIHNNIIFENICISNGSDGAIKYIFDAYISGGDNIVLTDPTFAMYPIYCQIFDANAVKVSYYEDLSFPLDDFLGAINPDIRMAIVVNPNNPVGSALDRGSLKKILEKCSECDTMLVIDEAYFYYYEETCIEEIKLYSNLIVLRTFSKLCSLAGVRIGYAAACPEIVQNLYKVRPSYDVNSFAVYFAEKLLDEPQLIMDTIKEARKGKEFLINQLQHNGIEYREGKANFVLIKCAGHVNEIISGLYKKNILVTGNFAHNYLKEYIRVTVGSIHHMSKFCDAFFNQWKAIDHKSP